MALESVTDETIAALLAQPKTVSNPGARETDKGSHKQTNYVVRGAAGDAFTLYLRQNNRIADDFSCGLCWHAPSGETLTLVRYNGAGHAHRNPGAREWLPRTCHIHRAMRACLDADRIQRDYVYPDMENAQDYPVDYRIEGKADPLFLFGIPGRDKARLATIVLERLLRAQARFDSLLVFADQGAIPRADLARLSNAGGEMVASLDAREDLQRKVRRRAA